MPRRADAIAGLKRQSNARDFKAAIAAPICRRMNKPLLTSVPLVFLVSESETEEARNKRRASTGRSSGETYIDLLTTLAPKARCELVRTAEPGPDSRPSEALSSYDGVFLTGSPLHVYSNSPAVRRQLDFMRAVFASGTPSFGSCAGLQVAVAAAGGSVRPRKDGQEVAFARRILRTAAGRTHPLLAERPDVYDAPAIHSDEVDSLPSDATLLATNRVTAVQAAEVRHDGGTFWGVQYHPELPLREIGDALRRQADSIVEQGFLTDLAAVDDYADQLARLDEEPDRRDLAWRLGLDDQVTDPVARQSELRRFIMDLVLPQKRRRGHL